MKKKLNLNLAAFLLGGIATTALPKLAKIVVFTGIAVFLYMEYDEWAYSQDHKQHIGGMDSEI